MPALYTELWAERDAIAKCGLENGARPRPRRPYRRFTEPVRNAAALGVGATSFTIDDLQSTAQELNAAFGGGAVSQFAQDHLAAPVPEPGLLGGGIGGIVLFGRTKRG